MINLSGTELFFIITTVVSLVVNIIQFIKDIPVYNSLCGLLNDCWVKTKYYQECIEKNEDICRKAIADLEGFSQEIYGILKTIRSKDKTFRAHSFTKSS